MSVLGPLLLGWEKNWAKSLHCGEHNVIQTPRLASAWYLGCVDSRPGPSLGTSRLGWSWSSLLTASVLSKNVGSITSKGRVEWVTRRPRDASSKERIVHGTLSSRDRTSGTFSSGTHRHGITLLKIQNHKYLINNFFKPICRALNMASPILTTLARPCSQSSRSGPL